MSWFYIRLGRFKAAQTLAERSRQQFTAVGAAPSPGMGSDPLITLAVLATIQGDYAAAVTYGQQARQAGLARHDRHNLAVAYYVLTGATLAQGDYETADDYGRRAYGLMEQLDNRWFSAYCRQSAGRK